MREQILTACLLAAAVAFAGVAAAGETPRPANAKVYIISPKNGDAVASPVQVLFGLSGMGVAPAGIEKKNTGHHHLLIDAVVPSANEPILKDAMHLHFGGGQTEASVKLTPGQHTLQLLLGDHNHIPHNPPVLSQKITITVK